MDAKLVMSTIEIEEWKKKVRQKRAEQVKDKKSKTDDSALISDDQEEKVDIEKEELRSALEKAEAALELEKKKALNAQLELEQVRQESERRIQEREKEFDNAR